MFKYKTELHCHTLQTSRCGKVAAEDVVKAYIDAHYSTLVITDHFGGKHITTENSEYEIQHFLEGYCAAKNAANGKINIILGMEINLTQNANDYLVYGDIESFLIKNPEMYKLNLSDFCSLAHENGLLVYQAHPFRNNITVTDPSPLDGIEVFNAHPRHDSRNDIALSWAKHFNKKMISGSDAHQTPDLTRSGILTENQITNEKELLSVLNEEKYELIII